MGGFNTLRSEKEGVGQSVWRSSLIGPLRPHKCNVDVHVATRDLQSRRLVKLIVRGIH